jgi:hypothetical protein
MKLAGEAGSLLKIEEDIRDAVAEAKKTIFRNKNCLSSRSIYGDGVRFDSVDVILRGFEFHFSGRILEAVGGAHRERNALRHFAKCRWKSWTLISTRRPGL